MSVTLPKKNPRTARGRVRPKSSQSEDLSMEVIMREIEAGLNEKLTPEEEEKILDELMAYGAKQAKKLGIKDRDVVRIIREFRANNRAS